MSATDNTGGNNGNLKPWVAGQSGNPGGRPKVKEELAARIRDYVPELVDKLKGIAMGDGLPPPTPGESVKAIQLLLAYGCGKPTEHVEVSGPDGEPVSLRPDYSMLTSGEARRELARLKESRFARLTPAEKREEAAELLKLAEEQEQSTAEE